MTDSDSQQTALAQETKSETIPSSAPSLSSALKRWVIISAAILGLGVVGWYSTLAYLRSRDCDAKQVVQLKWGMFDTPVVEELAKNATALAAINTQNPIIFLTEAAGLREKYTEPAGEVLCKAPPPPIACAFETGDCAESITGRTPVGHRLYVVAYKKDGLLSDVGISPMLPLLDSLTASVNVKQNNDLRYAVISSESLTKQELSAVSPAGYFASDPIASDEKTFTASEAGTQPIRVRYKRYPSDMEILSVTGHADVILLQDSLSSEKKAAWIHDLLAQNYLVYVYPVGEVYAYPNTK